MHGSGINKIFICRSNYLCTPVMWFNLPESFVKLLNLVLVYEKKFVILMFMVKVVKFLLITLWLLLLPISKKSDFGTGVVLKDKHHVYEILQLYL